MKFTVASNWHGDMEIHKAGCQHLTQRRKIQQVFETFEASTPRAAQEHQVADMEAGGHEPGSWRPDDFYLAPCARKADT